MNKLIELTETALIPMDSLKEKLDQIDDKIYKEFLGSRLKILIRMWEKGNTIGKYRGGKFTYYELEKETGRSHQSLKKWHDLYLKHPNKQKYITEVAGPKAEDWAKKALLLPETPSIHFSSESSKWTTPELIIDKTVELFGEIDLDPCSNTDFPNIPARTFFDKKTDGLNQNWHGKVYMNPPYGSVIKKWIEKVCDEFEKKNTTESIVLVPSRTDTKWFRRTRTYLKCFIWGRLKFSGNENCAPFPSMIVYLGKRESEFISTFSDIGDIHGVRDD